MSDSNKKNTEERISAKIMTEPIFSDSRTILFMIFSVLYSPFVIILNDIFAKKEIHNNEFWIKRAGLYFFICFSLYSLFFFIFQMDMKNMELVKLVIIYGIIYLAIKIQTNTYNYDIIEKENHKITEEELNIINIIQKQDVKNFGNKLKFRKKFLVLWGALLLLSFVFFSKNISLCFIILTLSIIGYDVFEQKYFKRDIMKLFWKKRLIYYFLFSLPILFVLYLNMIDFRI